MKNEDKKVPDAPKRLWVQTNSLMHYSGLISVGNVSYREYWIGHKHKAPDIKPYCYEEEEEYISLSRSWHKAKEVPENLHTLRYEELIKFVLDKRPSLKGKPFRIMF